MSALLLCGFLAPLASARAADVTVKIENFSFVPTTLTIHAGDRVTWINDDSEPHTATAKDRKSFDTGTIDPGSHAAVTFPKAGTYPYRCAIHPDMLGTVTVN